MDENIYQKIEAYLGGDMTTEAINEFEEIMANDPELQKAVKLSSEINHHLNNESWLSIDSIESNEAKQELEEYIKSDQAAKLKTNIQEAGNRFKKKRSTTNIRYLISAIAAVLVIGLLLNNLVFKQESLDDFYKTYYSTNDLPSLVKRGADKEALNTAITEFKNEEYEKAILSFRAFQEKSKENAPLLDAYIGFSYLKLNKTNDALKSFDALLTSDSIDSSKALWYKSLVYMKIGDTERLREILSQITTDPENFNYDKAIQILEKLE
ncbi:tetratricopeptide repeat protein [Aquimarina mytili]|uniref:Tetratricopeptide repeat protein n=1 Tax=Aquimarina mytili TaxID=874423 RepID=A0A936ZT09_9FLAO|nr:hypothetical protein [Aquimarina mytili]MBL0683767.1 hypothetical protein [Aquimarina mytili]